MVVMGDEGIGMTKRFLLGIEINSETLASRLAANMMPPIYMDRDQPGIIDASHRFAQKRFDHEYKWRP